VGTLLQALEIIFEVQRKRSNEKITRRKISFPTYKTHFFSLDPPIFKLHNFLISYSFKTIQNVIRMPLKFYKSSLNFDNNKATYK
jgi:hypothetical protein